MRFIPLIETIETNLVSNENENKNEQLRYVTNNYDVKYHDDAENLEKEQGFGLDPQEIVVYDPEKKEMVSLYVPKNQISPLYNNPGHYKYSADNYVPSYTETNLLTSNELKTYNKLFR
tara:strand:+ start:355 stop:708 length:354 start_codon:yes stop_codon:yes gene_type:complete